MTGGTVATMALETARPQDPERLPETAAVWWRAPADERHLRQVDRRWTASTVAHVVPFVAVAAFRAQLDEGYYAVVTEGEGHARQVRELPLDADLVILRRPIAGG